MKRSSAVIFEARGGNDKGPDGHRPDSLPILRALERHGFTARLEFYAQEREEDLIQRHLPRTNLVLSRVNPGNLSDTDRYWQFLARLKSGGAVVQTDPEVMSVLSFKDLFFKLRHTGLVPASTDFYASFQEMRRRLPLAVANGPRVLKKNFTSTGVGVWKLERSAGRIICTEAADNETRSFEDWNSLFRFLKPVFYEQASDRPRYFRDRQGLLDVPFLPGIEGGEVRVFFVYGEPVHILHKQPQSGSFSATLFSGAHYTSDARLNRWRPVVEFTLWGIRELQRLLGHRQLPVIWSVDSIPTGPGTYAFSDINAAAVGFTSPELVDLISERIAAGLSRELDGLPPAAPSLPTHFATTP